MPKQACQFNLWVNALGQKPGKRQACATLLFLQICFFQPLNVVASSQVPPTYKAKVAELAQTPTPIEKASYNENGVPSTWKFSNEQEWLVDGIGRDCAEILFFAKDSNCKNLHYVTKTVNPAMNRYSYNCYLDDPALVIGRAFTLVNYVWAPENFQPQVKAIMQSLNLHSTAPSAVPPSFLRNIASADMVRLLTENERVSKALTVSPLDSSLHEQAALLQAIFCSMNLAGGFADLRYALMRISAHLALANELSHNDLGTVGKVADIALECLSARDGIAAERASTLLASAIDPELRSILRAFRIRSTGDYREFDSKNHTEFEVIQYGLRSASRASHFNIEYVHKNYPITPVTWMRILSLGLLNYDARNLSMTKILEAEKSDFVRDYKFAKRVTNVDFGSIKYQLNLTPTRCVVSENGAPRLAAISFDDVAAFHCWHIMWALLTELHLYEIQSNPAAANNFIDRSYKEFESLSLIPFLMRRSELGKNSQPDFFGRAQYLFLHHPEIVTKSNWFHTNMRAASRIPQSRIVPAEKFFNPAIPFGTAFFYVDRRTLANCNLTLDGLAELKSWAPWEQRIAHDYALKKFGDNPTAAQWKNAYGPLADFNLEAMTDIARASAANPDECIKDFLKIAQVDPASYFSLAEYCLIVGKVTEAVEFAEKGVEACPDPIVTANFTSWLVAYYLKSNFLQKANTLSKRNINTAAMSALEQLALICEKEGNVLTSESLLYSSVRRYKNSGSLMGFLGRNKDKLPRFKEIFERGKVYFFPDGMKEVTVSDFHGNPQRGLKVTKADWMEPSSPLKAGTIIVAINGVPVEDRIQFDVLTHLTDKDSAAVIFWDGTKFSETEKKFGFSKDLNLRCRDYLGARNEAVRRIGGRPESHGDRSLAAILPVNFGANRAGILGIRYDNHYRLTKITQGMPASGAGLKLGDQIIAVDDSPIKGLYPRDIANRIRGELGTLVTLTLLREGKQFKVVLKRKHPMSDEALTYED